MPVLASGATELASLLEADLRKGGQSRASLGAKGEAFAWTSGLPVTLANYVSTSTVEGLSFSATRVAPSGTPANEVAEGGTKPSAVTITTAAQNLKKYAGIAAFSTEALLSTDGIAAAVAATMSSSIVLAYEADISAALSTDAGATATGATWAEGVLNGIAAVAANGGSPGIVVVPAADYAAAVGSPGLGYALNPTDGVTTLFGMTVVISQSATSGFGWVLDPGACLATQHVDSPIAVADSYSGLSTNELKIAIEAFLGFYVSAPASVCELTITTTPLAAKRR